METCDQRIRDRGVHVCGGCKEDIEVQMASRDREPFYVIEVFFGFEMCG